MILGFFVPGPLGVYATLVMGLELSQWGGGDEKKGAGF